MAWYLIKQQTLLYGVVLG